MKHHHYMKYLFVLFLFLSTSLMAQNKEEKMPGHITKIQKLEDVNVTGNRPHFIRLKGYYRSYQTNDSVMKYFNDGIVEYYINLKNGKTDLNAYSKEIFTTADSFPKTKSEHSWSATKEPSDLGRKRRHLLSNIERNIS